MCSFSAGCLLFRPRVFRYETVLPSYSSRSSSSMSLTCCHYVSSDNATRPEDRDRVHVRGPDSEAAATLHQVFALFQLKAETLMQCHDAIKLMEWKENTHTTA
ncbi:hypothetical protein PsorP6_007232 [Peronosclerospora sorghi]|uniref:Uncharacterized protein n=1 Tax=Peronosclerospora sorghi TaxID=230839 RepID=A0ACC0W7Z9_9STRA|nr:hypothetical protein PsorP6_007232 [Peronosclerospora sorghi]